jgi:hypothetical protein
MAAQQPPFAGNTPENGRLLGTSWHTSSGSAPSPQRHLCGGEITVMLVEREKNMKLGLLFIVMDLLTVLVYPFVFVYDKLRQLIKLDPLQKYL